LTDEFATEITEGTVTTMQELYPDIRRRMEEFWKKRYEEQLNNDLIAELVRRNNIDIPDSIVTSILDDMLKDYQNRLPDKKLPPDFDERDFRERGKKQAVFTAQWMYIRDAIIEKEGIDFDDTEIAEKAEEISRNTGIDSEQVLELFKSVPQYSDTFLFEKLLKLLQSWSDIKDVNDNDISSTGMSPLHIGQEHATPHDHHSHDHDHSHVHDHTHDHDHAHDDDQPREGGRDDETAAAEQHVAQDDAGQEAESNKEQ
jgi:FKBP-type peptidyl-prolyl cis-trans isomerase (trigger factor)